MWLYIPDSRCSQEVEGSNSDSPLLSENKTDMRKFLTRQYEYGRDSVEPPKPLNEHGYWHVAGYSVDHGDRSIGFHIPEPPQTVLWEWKEQLQ